MSLICQTSLKPCRQEAVAEGRASEYRSFSVLKNDKTKDVRMLYNPQSKFNGTVVSSLNIGENLHSERV